MLRTTIAFLLTLAVLATVVLAKPGIVRTRDGRTLQGDITETDAGVTIETKGIRFSIHQANVESIVYQENIEDQLRQRLEQLGPQDFEARMRLAREAFDARLYELARTAVDQALQIEPNSREAVTLMDTIQNHLRLERIGERPTTRPDAARTDRTQRPKLDPQQINMIRQHELRRADVNVPIRFESEVERRYAARSRLDVRDLRRRSTIERALEILGTRDPRLTEDVRVMRDPMALADFRQQVQPILLAGCATSGCHGGEGAGDLALIAPAGDEASAYTNFYLLQTYRRGEVLAADEGRIFDRSAAQRLINRVRPEQSLVLEYGLPPNVAEIDHPRVAGFRPAFRSRQDPRYQQVLAWIRSLPPPEPDYGIALAPAEPTAAEPEPAPVEPITAPVTQPTTQPTEPTAP